MDLRKHLEFFNPDIEENIHIIGLGAIGSHVAIMLTRLGLNNIHIYDFDNVNKHNIANQHYFEADIGFSKTVCTQEYMENVCCNVEIVPYDDGYIKQNLNGYVFLCVDDIELRKEIVEENRHNKQIKAMFDFRMRLTDAQAYAANWSDPTSIIRLLKTMSFTKEEAKEATPLSACGTTLAVLPTIWCIVSLGIANFINFTKGGHIKEFTMFDTFHQTLY